MGEAWFMAPERRMYPRLFDPLDSVADKEIESALEQIATGPGGFGQLREWTIWYHYLLPRLIGRDWGPCIWHPAELLITAFMAQHPDSNGHWPYRDFRADALRTLGRYIMSPPFWPDGELDVERCLNKRERWNGLFGWFDADGLMSASLSFCVKYLAAEEVGAWFQSVLAIPDRYWQAQLIAWLVGAYPILTNEIGQPDEFAKDGPFRIDWNWSLTLDGHYTGDFRPPIHLVPFLPAENRETIVQIARGMEVEAFFEDLATDPALAAVAAETADMPERFLQLYRNRPASG